MIAVINVSEEKGVPYSRTGLQHYRVQLNTIRLVEFTHVADHGMSRCLQLASEALETIDIGQKIDEHIKKDIYQAFSLFGQE